MQNSKIRVDLFSKKIKLFKPKREAVMADYKFDGKEFRDRRGSRIGEIDGKYIALPTEAESARLMANTFEIAMGEE